MLRRLGGADYALETASVRGSPDEKARKDLGGVDTGDAVEAITHGEPPEDEERPWTFVLTFKPSWLGSTRASFWGAKRSLQWSQRKKEFTLRQVLYRAGRYVPGAYHRSVLEGLG